MIHKLSFVVFCGSMMFLNVYGGFRKSRIARFAKRNRFAVPGSYKRSTDPMIRRIAKFADQDEESASAKKFQRKLNKKFEKLAFLKNKKYGKNDFSALGAKYQDSLVASTLDIFDDNVQVSLSDVERKYQKELSERFGRKLEKKETAPVYVGWVNSLVGYGVFSNKALKKGTFLGECAGQVKHIEKVSQKNEYIYHYPSSKPEKQFVIDVSTEGNYFRFLNHDGQSNIEGEYVYHKGLWHLIFIAARDIRAGDQLLLDYGPEFWEGRKRPLPLS
ncbi:SET domain-containing protein-lysine N-methyltransferase [Candidatus Babeliales bacterium]|nr:SET domain-containing protein-lysine N-methyltransferase [Candidatus Babeliales bacterium]